MIIAYVGEFLIQVICVVLLTVGGNAVIRCVFKLTNEKKEDDGNKLGRFIGALERAVMAVGIYLDKWEIVTAVIALKALARFKQLDDKNFAEYFLVGSLSSIIFCVVFIELYKHFIGFFPENRLLWLSKAIPSSLGCL
ncbi:hypothetical protein D3C87_102980 [compost metagenome]